MNPRCATLGYDRNGKKHSMFPFEAVEIVNKVLNMSYLLERADLSEIDADIWELNIVINHEIKVAQAHWNKIVTKATKKK